MLRAFSTAATGMTAQQMIVDTIANNLANMNTAGFKRSMIDFQDLVYLKLQEPGREVASGVEAPSGFELGSGVRPVRDKRRWPDPTWRQLVPTRELLPLRETGREEPGLDGQHRRLPRRTRPSAGAVKS